MKRLLPCGNKISNEDTPCFQAYLSLPRGYASAAGLIAMMTDHYSNLVRMKYAEYYLDLNLVVLWIMLKLAITFRCSN